MRDDKYDAKLTRRAHSARLIATCEAVSTPSADSRETRAMVRRAPLDARLDAIELGRVVAARADAAVASRDHASAPIALDASGGARVMSPTLRPAYRVDTDRIIGAASGRRIVADRPLALRDRGLTIKAETAVRHALTSAVVECVGDALTYMSERDPGAMAIASTEARDLSLAIETRSAGPTVAAMALAASREADRATPDRYAASYRADRAGIVDPATWTVPSLRERKAAETHDRALRHAAMVAKRD